MLKYLFMPRLLLFAQRRRRRRIRFFSSSHLTLYIRSSHIQESSKQIKKKNKTHSTRREFIIQQRESFDYEALIESLHLYRKWIDISKSLYKKSKWKYIYTGTVVDYPHSMSVSLVTDGLYSQFYTSVDQQAYRRKRSAMLCYTTHIDCSHCRRRRIGSTQTWRHLYKQPNKNNPCGRVGVLYLKCITGEYIYTGNMFSYATLPGCC
jgi:hypothetical protein